MINSSERRTRRRACWCCRGGRQLGRKKSRAASAWLEASGWRTDIIERRHFGDIALSKDDPPYLVSGLDKVEPRLALARHGFPYMIDAGIGHGPGDFEGIQIRTIAKGQAIDGLWGAPTAGAPSRVETLQDSPAYRELERHIGRCGTFEFAEASVAVPFVGAASGALTLAHIIRLASLEARTRAVSDGARCSADGDVGCHAAAAADQPRRPRIPTRCCARLGQPRRGG